MEESKLLKVPTKRCRLLFALVYLIRIMFTLLIPVGPVHSVKQWAVTKQAPRSSVQGPRSGAPQGSCSVDSNPDLLIMGRPVYLLSYRCHDAACWIYRLNVDIFPCCEFFVSYVKIFFIYFERCSVEPLSGHFFPHWTWIFQKQWNIKCSLFLGSGLFLGPTHLKISENLPVKNVKRKNFV